MNIASVDKLAKDNSGVKQQPVRQELFDITVDSERVKTKESKETVRAFFITITKKNRSKNFGSAKEQNLLENL